MRLIAAALCTWILLLAAEISPVPVSLVLLVASICAVLVATLTRRHPLAKRLLFALVASALCLASLQWQIASSQSDSLRTAVEQRATLRVSAQVASDPVEIKHKSGSDPRFMAQIKLLEPKAFAGSAGFLLGDARVSGLRQGDAIDAVVALRPAFNQKFGFSANLHSLIGAHHESSGLDVIHAIRNSFLANLAGITPDAAGLVSGLTIGDTSKVSATTLDDFKIVSLTHLAAVSGANCAIVLTAAALIISRLVRKRWLRAGVSLAVIAGYLALVGPQSSILRASAMVAAVIIGSALGRKIDPLDALGLAALVLFVVDPWLASDYGFALSTLATIGILVIAPKLSVYLARWLPQWLSLAIAVTLSAQIMCQPILLVLQPGLPVYSIAANLLAEPLVAPVTMLGLLACIVAPVAPVLTIALCKLASLATWCIVAEAHWFARQDSATLGWPQGLFGILLAAVFVVAIFLLAISRQKYRAFAFAAAVAVVAISSSTLMQSTIRLHAWSSKNFTLVNCDVGQGDALVIKSRGEIAVVDVGRDDAPIDNCLKDLGILKIDLLVLTHYDLDHVGGLSGALNQRNVKLAMLTSFHDSRPKADFCDRLLAAKGVSIVRAQVGLNGKLGDFDWQVLSPHKDAPEAEDSNDGSVTMLWQDSRMALFTMADLGEKGQLRLGAEQSALLAAGFGGRQVVVKVAHHGSADQSSEFYEAIQPQIALISVGKNNGYGHPTNKTLALLQSVGAAVFRTDKQGALGVIEGPSGLSFAVSGGG